MSKGIITKGYENAIRFGRFRGKTLNPDDIRYHIFKAYKNIAEDDDSYPDVPDANHIKESNQWFFDKEVEYEEAYAPWKTGRGKQPPELSEKLDSLRKWRDAPGKLYGFTLEDYEQDDANRKKAIDDLYKIVRGEKLTQKTFKEFNPIITMYHGYHKNLKSYNDKAKDISIEREKTGEAIKKGEEATKAAREKALEEISKKKNFYEDVITKKDERIVELKDEISKLRKPSTREYIKNKVQNGSYSLSKDELKKQLQKDIGKGVVDDENIDELVAAIYKEANLHIIKNRKKIARLARLQGYNPEALSQLPEETQQMINDYVNEKFNEDLVRNNRKYKLPVAKHTLGDREPLFMNPNLKRGAWSV